MRVFDFDAAIVRMPAPSVVNGLRDGDRDDPSHEGVLAEHRAYIAALEAAGVSVEILPPLDAFPDSVFVEDQAFVVPEGAIVLRPGAPTRIGEAAGIAPALRRRFARVLELDEGHADGGDILILPDEILIGLSARTDRAGAERFVALAAELGRTARIVETPRGILHFKTASALVDEETVIATPVLAPCFAGYDVLVTPEGEEAAANLVRVNDRVLVSAAFPRTIDLLAARGLDLVALDTREIAKIDAGLSCMSLRWKAL
ncbi:arginine deiminase family protein [Sphingosinicella sp. LHD-64]|uniref:dimethylarginine dimethylaminohydrolase family protein n=1 Tax=Sphingosinicella sp. LHD-64 TaxID=3072139 RepID=UPI00280E8889|nr:arginine deiminase family protein [Sphingosinicella sp. LHD-64]MDQ8754992.1 arginine deiminase family protein [Sphingosinicella sp. LHD-64]